MKIEVKDLSLEEKVGQMLMIGLNMSNPIGKIEELILKYKVGGVLLYKKNYKNYHQLVELVNYIKKLSSANKIPLLIAIDQEGGRVNRMPPEFKNIPAVNKLAKYKEEDLVEKASLITGKMLYQTGFNMDFAPVLDIKRFGDGQAIGDRAFSENKEEVIKYGIEMMKGLKSKNIIPVIKHFPGHGATTKDTHFVLPTIRKDLKELEEEDMKPFEEAIKAGADCILIGHLKIKKATFAYPTSMSKRFIGRYLRKKYHYNGIIITDDMRMKSVRTFYGKNKPIKKAFEAGNDIILFKYGKKEKVIEEIINEVKKDKKKEARVNKSVRRILKLKERYGINNNEIKENEDFVKEMNKQIHEIREKMEGKH